MMKLWKKWNEMSVEMTYIKIAEQYNVTKSTISAGIYRYRQTPEYKDIRDKLFGDK